METHVFGRYEGKKGSSECATDSRYIHELIYLKARQLWLYIYTKSGDRTGRRYRDQ